ncbi:hypothetical protein C5O23_08825 [Duncaniella muris]|uniref:Uncharacterized protein n=1 Tax=Duncaniella muris TaxID=2094150 RepID=A0A2V1IM65_9BACT|nr:hypothetical protein [Duncaniella muris]PWB01645.1 hypothetical protein C5O23_08825 [Duncaniella muris]
MLKLKVVTDFRDRDNIEHIHRKGDVLTLSDLNRVNDMVSRKLCVIISVETPTPSEAPQSKEMVSFQGTSYEINVIKEALAAIGVSVAANAKAKGVENALSKLTEEQTQALNDALTQE